LYVNYLHIRHRRVETQVNIARFWVFTAGLLRIYIFRDVTVCLLVGVLESLKLFILDLLELSS